MSLVHPGGPFDLMSRRVIAASSRKIAERIVKEIKQFEVGRDDDDAAGAETSLTGPVGCGHI